MRFLHKFKGNITLIFLVVIAVIRIMPCYKTRCEHSFEETDNWKILQEVKFFRDNTLRLFSDKVKKYLPSPHSELVLGMVLGIDEFDMLPKFKDALVNTGTIHVVVVSGFNISLVFSIVMRLLGSPYKLRNLLIAQVITFFYAFLTGLEPPIVRAWIMGSIASWGRFYGRSIDILSVLLFAGLVLISIDPYTLFSLSFQLSFLATLSLILFEPVISERNPFKKGVLIEDLNATLSAQILVWPLISFHFGRVSLISPLVNMLVLWTVPISTIIGVFFVLLGVVYEEFCYITAFPLYAFLDIFVTVVDAFNLHFSPVIDYSISMHWLIIYYLGCFILFISLKEGRGAG